MAWSTGNREQRGYGREWTHKRLVVLKRDSYLCQCEHCKAEGRTRIATEVDHIMSKARARTAGWSNARIESLDNLQAINKDCHQRKTLEEEGKTLKPRVRIGLDGFPVARK